MYSGMTSELNRTEGQGNMTEQEYKEALDILSERIAQEGEHRINAFRNRIGAKLQTYADGFIDAADREMTIDLGKALRGQMRQILRLLKSEGVKIEGRL